MIGIEEELKLVGGWPSPFVLRARIALNLKGVTYENLEEELGNKSELLLKSNPIYKKIPVLIHGGKPLCESMIIVQYIDDVWTTTGPSILPSDPYDLAIARFWAFYIDDKWDPSLFLLLKAKSAEARAEAAEQCAAGLQLLEKAFESCSKGKGFFGGDSIGYIDIALGCFLGWIAVVEELSGIKFLDEAKVPKLVGWAGKFRSDDAVKEVLPETDKLLGFAKKLQDFLDVASAE